MDYFTACEGCWFRSYAFFVCVYVLVGFCMLVWFGLSGDLVVGWLSLIGCQSPVCLSVCLASKFVHSFARRSSVPLVTVACSIFFQRPPVGWQAGGFSCLGVVLIEMFLCLRWRALVGSLRSDWVLVRPKSL